MSKKLLRTFTKSCLDSPLSSSKSINSSCSRLYATKGGWTSPEVAATAFAPNKKIMLPENAFKGKVAFVTGGGTGLGKSLATTLSALGAEVCIASRRLPVLESAAKEISAITGNQVLPIQCDVRNPEKVKEAVDACVESFGSLPHCVVNNAAGNFISPTERLSANAFKTVVDIVLLGTANVTLELGRRLIEKKQAASFVAVTTHYVNEGSAFVTPSASAKAGVEVLHKSLASEWGRYGLRFNTIQPGPIETEGAFSRLDPTGQFMEKAIRNVPAGRCGEPEEFANLASYLLSDYANWITGSSFRLDGGEFSSLAGEFNALKVVTNEQWDMMEAIIRQSNQKQKK